MRIAISSYGQETSSFSPVPTTLETFGLYGLFEDEEIVRRCSTVGAIGGFMHTLDASTDWMPLPLIHGWAGASGPLRADVLDFFAKKIEAKLRASLPIDAMYFALHGAAVAEGVYDTEAYLLDVVRQVIGDEIPLVISLDHHANLTQAMVDRVDALVGLRTQPHDPFETGVLAGQLMLGILNGETKPVMAWRKIPLLTHQEQFLTDRGPMQEWFELARAIEKRSGVLSASTFPMQPWLDVPEGGWAVAVVTDGDQSLAEMLAEELAERAWALRESFCRLDSIAPEAAIRYAVAAEHGLVVLTDTGDSVFGGATGASTTLLAEMIRQEISVLALVPLVDPETVAAAIEVGVGGRLTAAVGGKLDPNFAEPLKLTARVAGIGGGRFDISILGFESFDLGRSVLLEVGSIRVLVSEKRGIGGNHPIVYEHFGIDIAAARMIVLKSSSNWQFYQPWIAEVVRVDTPGATTSHLEDLAWKNIPRPIYPLDAMTGIERI